MAAPKLVCEGHVFPTSETLNTETLITRKRFIFLAVTQGMGSSIDTQAPFPYNRAI